MVDSSGGAAGPGGQSACDPAPRPHEREATQDAQGPRSARRGGTPSRTHGGRDRGPPRMGRPRCAGRPERPAGHFQPRPISGTQGCLPQGRRLRRGRGYPRAGFAGESPVVGGRAEADRARTPHPRALLRPRPPREGDRAEVLGKTRHSREGGQADAAQGRMRAEGTAGARGVWKRGGGGMRRYGIRGGSLFLTLGLLATLTFALGVLYLDPGDSWTQTDGSQAAQAGVSVEEPVARVAYRLGPSAVQINVAGVQQTPYGTQEGEGIGSGVIYRSDGYIITNHHVVEGAREVDVSFADGTTERGKVVGTDPTTEIAVIEVNRDNLPAANFVEEQDPVVGQMTIAVGSPSGFESTVTSGVVSGVGREVPSEYTGGRQDNALVDLIQTDAAISPGNSGGALANRDGEIIGINVAYLPPSETGAVNIGFAIPSDTAISVADQLIETGEVSTPYLGAAATGVRRGDVITVLGGSDVEGYGDLLGALRDYQPGDTARLTVFRNGDERTLDVTLSERPK